MKQLHELQEIISDAVQELKFPEYPAQLYEPITYILSLGGKRMRPALLLMACDLFGGDAAVVGHPVMAMDDVELALAGDVGCLKSVPAGLLARRDGH